MATSMTRLILFASLILVLGSCDGNPRAYLWYPGNRRLVIGAWQRTLDEVCYRCGENTYNPRTLQRGGMWTCESAERGGFYVAAYRRLGPART